MKAVPRSLEVGEVGEPLDADDEDVLGAAAADHVVGQRDAVAEAGAGGRDVEGGGLLGAELVGDRGRDGRGLVGVGDRGDDDAADLLRRRSRRASSACREASTDIVCTVSSGAAQRRVLMPERCRIHSSEESMASTISALGTTRVGR